MIGMMMKQEGMSIFQVHRIPDKKKEQFLSRAQDSLDDKVFNGPPPTNAIRWPLEEHMIRSRISTLNVLMIVN